MKGGAKVVVEKHRHDGVFVATGGKDDAIVTRNLDPGHSVYGEKRIAVEVHPHRPHSVGGRQAPLLTSASPLLRCAPVCAAVLCLRCCAAARRWAMRRWSTGCGIPSAVSWRPPSWPGCRTCTSSTSEPQQVLKAMGFSAAGTYGHATSAISRETHCHCVLQWSISHRKGRAN